MVSFTFMPLYPRGKVPPVSIEPIYWAQLSRFYLRTETEYSLLNDVF
jgi:hypothetical protein